MSSSTTAAVTVTPNAWVQVCDLLAMKISRHNLAKWIHPCTFVSDSGRALRVRVESEDFGAYIHRNFAADIADALSEIGREGTIVVFSAEEAPSAEVSSVAVAPSARLYRLLDDVQVMELPDPEWLIDGVLPRNGTGGIYGPPGSYKTTMVAGLHVAVATGQAWFGHRIVRRGPSIYVGAEDVPGFKLRLAAAKRAANLPLTVAIGVYCFPEAIDLRDAAGVSQFIKFARDRDLEVELVTIDTYAAATPGASENSSEDTTVAMAHAQQIRDGLNATVILVHHTNAAGSRERGHSGMRGAADTMISLTPVDDVVHVECSKQRNGAPFETLTLKPMPVPEGGCTLRLAADVIPTSGLTALQAKALAALREASGGDGMTKAAWRAICSDMNERAFYKVAKVLEEKRLVMKVGSTHFKAGAGQ